MGFIKSLFNTLADPRLFFILACVSLILLVWKREKIASNLVGYGLLGLLSAFFLFGAFDPNFRLIITKPDNVPIVGLIFLLVYFDPWLAGVVLPGLIIAGLIAIPYIDKNPKGNGYYTFAERKAEITLFLFGFVILWSSLIVLGTFLRGPNWNFFGPFEVWDIHKLEALTNVNLSEYVWVRGLGTALPTNWFVREIAGILVVLVYVFVLPVVLARGLLKRYYDKLGPA